MENEEKNAGDYVMPDKATGEKGEIHFHNDCHKMMGVMGTLDSWPFRWCLDGENRSTKSKVIQVPSLCQWHATYRVFH